MEFLFVDPIKYDEFGKVKFINPTVYTTKFDKPILMVAIMPEISFAGPIEEPAAPFYNFADPAEFLGLKPRSYPIPEAPVMKRAIYRLNSKNSAGVCEYKFVRVDE